MKSQPAVREKHLDGIRGMAAVWVATLHFFRSFDNGFLALDLINRSPISVLWNGHFAVAIFFVLSGFLFFGKFYRADFTSAGTAALKRYLRLSGPLLAASLAAYCLHVAGAFTNAQEAARNGSDWLMRWYQFPPDLLFSIQEPLWNSFFSFDASHTYNANLWTITYELLTVCAVLALGAICRYLPLRLQALLLLAAAVGTYGGHHFTFILGAMLALGLRHRPVNLGPWMSTLLLAAALSMGCLSQPAAFRGLSFTLVYPFAALLLIGTVETSAPLKKLFSARVLGWLGQISFGVYLMHFLVINSAASSVSLQTHSPLLTAITYAALTLGAAVAFTFLVDRPWIAFLDKLFSAKAAAPALDEIAAR